MNWVAKRLEEVCSLKTGKLDSNAAVPNGQFPFFTCAQETFRIDKAAFDTEAVLLGGNNAAGVYPLKYFKGEFNAYQRTYVIESTDRKALSIRFLYYSLHQSLSHFQSASIGAATQYLTKSLLNNFKVLLPPIATQESIVDTLSGYDDLIENNQRRMVLLEESARLLYSEWFIRLRFPGHEHTRVIDGVPEGWEQKALGELCSEVRESVSPDMLEPDTPYIGLEHMPRRSISLNVWGKVEQVTSSKHRFKAGEILFGKIRPYFHKVGVAFVDGVASSDAIVIRPVEEMLHGLVLMTVSSDGFIAVTSQTMKEGSKMPRADWKQMQAYSVPLPPSGLLNTFDGVIQPIIAQLKVLTFANQKLRTARDLLLPRLMSGEIAV
jgi:type I restriction enzyme, S subunit